MEVQEELDELKQEKREIKRKLQLADGIVKEDLYTAYYAVSENEEIVGDKEIEIPGMEQHEDPKCGKTPVEYYDEKLPLILDQCIRNIFEVRKITSELQKNTSWEKVMVEKIVNSVNGQGKFDEFTKNDIDDVIKMFQELQTKVEG